MIDLGYTENPYTWNNRRAGLANIQERLDRIFGNSNWTLVFSRATVQHLYAFGSDLKPILLHSNPPSPSRPKPFCFESMWTRDPSVGMIISQGWKRGTSSPNLSQIMVNLKYTKLTLKKWNKLYFGHIQSKIVELKKLIDTLQYLPQSSTILEKERQTSRELDEILLREQIL